MFKQQRAMFNMTGLDEMTMSHDNRNLSLNITGDSTDIEAINNPEIDDLSGVPVVAFVFLLIFIVLIFLASFIGNVFVFVVFYKRRLQLMTISNRFVMNLSVSCFLMAVFVMPFSIITTATHSWHFGDGWCQITGMLTSLLFSACILTLLLISCDRYVAIVSPFHYNMRFTTDRSTYMIIAVWTLSVLYSLPPVFGWNHIAFQPSQGSCTVNWRDSDPTHMSYNIFLTIVCFVLPFSLMLWIYIVLYRATKKITARARRNSVQPDSSSADLAGDEQRAISRRGSSNSLIFTRRNSSNSISLRRQDSFVNGRRRSSVVSRSLAMLFHKDDWKAAKTGLVVIATFLLCWTPYFVVILIESVLGNASRLPAVVQCLAYWIALSASAINPLVYAFRNKTIRKELRILLRRGSATLETNVQMRSCRRSLDSDISPQDRVRLANILAKRIGQQNGSTATMQTNIPITNGNVLSATNIPIRNGSVLSTTNIPIRNGSVLSTIGDRGPRSMRKSLNNNSCQSSVSINATDTMSRVDI